MAELTYKSLMEEILEGDLKELRLHPDDVSVIEDRIYFGLGESPIAHRFYDDVGPYLLFNDCKLRYDYSAELRNWS